MIQYRMYRYYLLAGFGLAMLAGCTQDMAGDDQTLSAESEILRKNGNALVESGNLPEAIVVFDKLIATDPANSLAYNSKAVAFDYSGNHLAAQELYKTALSFSPDSLPVKNNLAMSLILNHQLSQAIMLLESLMHIKTDNVSQSKIVHHNLALAYGISGQHAKATKINLLDMTEEQAKANIAFYEQYVADFAKGIKNPNKMIIPNVDHEIGFITPPALKLTVHPDAKKEDDTSGEAGFVQTSVVESTAYDNHK